MNAYFNNQSIFQLINKWKKHLIILSVIVAVLSGAATYLITPLFKSQAILYPVNIAPYSDENETEQMLQILNSTDLKFRLVDSLNLNEHYKLNTEDPLYLSTLMYYLSEYISISKTEYESAKIKVLDRDPKFAKQIVDVYIDLFNKKIRELHRIKYKEVMDIKHKEIQRKTAEIDSLVNIMDSLRQNYHLLDYNIQTQEVTRGYYAVLAKNPSKAQEAKEILKNLELHGAELKKLSFVISKEREVLQKLKKEYEEKYTEFHKEIVFAQVVEKPFVADKKYSPIRWLYVMFSVIGALVLALIVIAYIESKKTENIA